MNKHKWYWSLVALIVIAVIGLTAGCGTLTAPVKEQAKPTINSFTASPAQITAGERTTLSWSVSGATAVNIQPQIGDSGMTGSILISPTATTTYTLTATNQAGSSTSSAQITVNPAFAGKPDLVVTDIWLSGSAIYYKIANQGNAASPPSKTNLYVNDSLATDDWVDNIAAGEEQTTFFPNLGWAWPIDWNPITGKFPTFNMKVCVDVDNNAAEGNEGNNCFTEAWGMPYSYYFLQQANLAEWRSGAGKVRWGSHITERSGAVHRVSYSPILVMCPEQVSNGWIMGKFAEFYLDEETNAPYTRKMEVPVASKFTAQVGFGPGVTSSDGVRVAFGYTDEIGNVVLFPKMDVYSDGQLHTYEVDLSPIEGKMTEFILWVEAKDSPEGDCVRWYEPSIIQPETGL